MVVLDDQRRLRWVNGAATALLELPREHLLGLRVDDLTPEWLRPCLEEGWPVFLRDGSIVQRRTLTLRNGSTIEVDYCATANVLPGHHLAIYMEHDHRAPRASGDGAARAPLTPRELEVVQLLAMGLSGSTIAEQLVISPETVRTHIRNAMEKRGARTRAHLIALAMRDGLIRP